MAEVVTSVAEFCALSLFSGMQDAADGIPSLPVSSRRRHAAVAASGRAGDDVIGAFAGHPTFTVSALADVALLAGCREDYLPLLIAAFDAMLDPQFPIALFTRSRASFFPYLIVSGPVRHQLGINCGANVFGPGFRANATIGRAVRLGLARFAGARMDATGPSALGTAYRFACVIGEDEENSPWSPLHGDFGFASTQSSVMVLAASQPGHVDQHLAVDPDLLVHAFASEVIAPHCFHRLDVEVPAGGHAPKAIVVLGGDHRGYFRDAGWDRAQVKAALFAAAETDSALVRAAGYRLAGPHRPHTRSNGRISPLGTADDVLLVSAGGGSSRSMVGSAVFGAIRPVDVPHGSSLPASPPTGAPASIDDYDDIVVRYMDAGSTDGWPVIPPDGASVAELVAASGRDGTSEIGSAPWRTTPITVTDAAINACMAGCAPEHMPLLVAMLTTLFSPEAGIGIGAHAASAGGYTCLFVIHGPIARQLGLNSGAGLFGPGNYANVALGRAIRLSMMNLAGLKPNLADRSGVGQAYKYGAVFATDDESPWRSLGLAAHLADGESGFTLIWGFHTELSFNEEATTPEELLRSVAGSVTLQGYDSPSGRVPGTNELPDGAIMWVKALQQRGLVIVMSEGHRALLDQAGWDYRQSRDFIAEHVSRSIGELRRSGFATSPLFEFDQPDDDRVHLVSAPEKVVLVAAGGAGGAALVYIASDFFPRRLDL